MDCWCGPQCCNGDDQSRGRSTENLWKCSGKLSVEVYRDTCRCSCSTQWSATGFRRFKTTHDAPRRWQCYNPPPPSPKLQAKCYKGPGWGATEPSGRGVAATPGRALSGAPPIRSTPISQSTLAALPRALPEISHLLKFGDGGNWKGVFALNCPKLVCQFAKDLRQLRALFLRCTKQNTDRSLRKLRTQFATNFLGRHVCRTKSPPKKLQIDTNNGLKNKKSKTCPKMFKSLLRCLKISHRHFSKSFSPPKICTKKKFLFHREALQG